jgi:hypothetical protein
MKKQRFLKFVCIGAAARDLSNHTNDYRLIACHAASIPEDKIPPNEMNAATTFLAFCSGQIRRPFKWMFARTEETQPNKPKEETK